MIQVASFLYLKMDYLSHGVTVPGQSVRTVGRLFVLSVNAAEASLFTKSLYLHLMRLKTDQHVCELLWFTSRLWQGRSTASNTGPLQQAGRVWCFKSLLKLMQRL